MISLIIIAICAICDAIMDIVSHKFDNSVFKNLNPYIWNPYYSWKNKYIDRTYEKGRRKFLGFNLHPAFTDSWHFFKSLKIILWCVALVAYSPIFDFDNIFLSSVLDILVIGTLRNLVFSMFYNHLLLNTD